MSDCISGHKVFIYDRGGTKRLAEITDIAQIKWNRARDSISEATVTVLGQACQDQKDTLAAIEPHRHELVIYRGDDRVWEGPINRSGDEPTSFEIAAYDVFNYLMFTPMTQAWSSAYPNTEEVTTRIERIVEYELTHSFPMPDPAGGPDLVVQPWELISAPANILPFFTAHHFPNEARTSSSTVAGQMMVGEHIQNLARSSGIDYTVVGRGIHVWDTSRSLGQIRQLVDSDFDNGVIVTAYGADHAEYAMVSSDQGATLGRASDPDPTRRDYYGPWVKLFTVYNEDDTQAPTQSDLDSQASRNISGRSPVPVEVRVPDNSRIYLDDTLTINDLVPGVRVPLLGTLNARQISQMQKIDLVTVTETSAGETVQVTMSPATQVDSDEV